jgi:hypothetical protein
MSIRTLHTPTAPPAKGTVIHLCSTDSLARRDAYRCVMGAVEGSDPEGRVNASTLVGTRTAYFDQPIDHNPGAPIGSLWQPDPSDGLRWPSYTWHPVATCPLR